MRNHEIQFTQVMHEAVNLYNNFRDILQNRVLNAEAKNRGANANYLRDEMPAQIEQIEMSVTSLGQIIQQLSDHELLLKRATDLIDKRYKLTVKQ